MIMNRSDSYKSAVDEPSVPPQKPPRPPLPVVHQESLDWIFIRSKLLFDMNSSECNIKVTKNKNPKKSSPQFNSFNLIEYYLEERKHEYTTPTTVIPEL